MGIAGAGAQCSHDDGGPTALLTNVLCNRVDRLCCEGDDGRAARQAGEFLLSRIAQFGQAWSRHESHIWQKLFKNGAHGGGTQQQGFLIAAPMENAVGEDMAAFKVGTNLHFINREKRHIDFGWHRLNRAHPITGVDGNDLFFARYQGYGLITRTQPHLVVDLTRQEAQRQADHPLAMR